MLAVLLKECEKRGVSIRYSEPVTEVSRTAESFTVITDTARYNASIVVITTGGASYPQCGTTGDGYRLAASLGQPVTETAPALTPLLVRPFPFAALMGLSFEGMRFSVWREGKKVADHTGDVLFTHLGLSGPGILDASRGIRPGDVVRLSFAGMRREEFAADIARRAAENPNWQVGTILAKYPIPERLNRKLLKISGIPEDQKCAHFSAAQRLVLVTNCTEFPLTVTALGDYKIAMVTRGGVALDSVNMKTMESKSRARPFLCRRGAGYRWRYRRLQPAGCVLDRVSCCAGNPETVWQITAVPSIREYPAGEEAGRSRAHPITT